MRTLEVYISGIDTTYATINEAIEAMRALHNAGKHPIMHITTTHYEYTSQLYTSTDRVYFYNRLDKLDSLEAHSYSYNGKSGKLYSSYWHRDKLARILGL